MCYYHNSSKHSCASTGRLSNRQPSGVYNMRLSRSDAIAAVSSWPESLSEQQARALVEQLSTLEFEINEVVELVGKQLVESELSEFASARMQERKK